MNYLSVISLEQAKTYLRVDHDASDLEISGMISAACAYVEKYTNHLLFAREVVYYPDDNGCILVYDFPINSIIGPTAAEQKKKAGHTIFDIGLNEDTLSLNVGYEDVGDIPFDLIQSIYQIISIWFFGSEDKSQKHVVPAIVNDVLNVNKRFVL